MNQSKLPMTADDDWEAGDEIDLRHYWNVIRRRKGSILGLALGVGLLTTLLVFAMTPIYRAATTLLIESQQNKVVSIDEVYGLDTRGKEYLATQIEIMGARPIAEAVVDRLGLVTKPEFAPDDASAAGIALPSWLPFGLQKPAKPSAPVRREQVVDAYMKMLSIEPVRNTLLVRVQFDSADAKFAAQVADAHAKAYIESTLDARVDATKSANDWMGTRLETLRKDLQASEANLQAYRESEQIVDVTGLKALPAAEISNLSSRQLEARQALASAEIAYLQVTPATGQKVELLGVPALLNDDGMRRAQAAQATAQQAVAELESRYGPSHPRMVAAKGELEQATENLNRQARSVTEGIRKRYEAAKSEEAAIAAALNRARQQYQTVGRKESKLESLQREVDTNRQLYELFFKRLSETSATGDLTNAQARVVEAAAVPRIPVKPNKRLMVTVSVLLTLMLGIALALLLESLDNTVKGSGDVDEKLGRPLLGMVPLLKGDALAAASSIGRDGQTRETDGRFAEALRTIRTAVSLDNLDQPHKVVLVTSSVAGEGKSLISLNLAVAFASAEKTLLIDGDLRRPSIGRMLGIARDKPGLSELLADNAKLADCLTTTGIENLDVLSTGFIPPDPLQMLASSRMANALKVLANTYGRIVIDCPPILPVSDAALLSKYASCLLYVVKSDATALPQIRNGLALLDRVNAPVMGLVISQLDTRKAEKNSDYGYAGYYESYSPKA